MKSNGVLTGQCCSGKVTLRTGRIERRSKRVFHVTEIDASTSPH